MRKPGASKPTAGINLFLYFVAHAPEMPADYGADLYHPLTSKTVPAPNLGSGYVRPARESDRERFTPLERIAHWRMSYAASQIRVLKEFEP